MSDSLDPRPKPSKEEPEGEVSFVRRLHARYGEGVDPEIQLQSPEEVLEQETPRERSEESSGSSSSRGLYEKLSDQVTIGRRYQLQREIARGGMGAIIRVWDEDLRRNLAMKVMHRTASEEELGENVDPERLGRFLEEAQITGQLDHPGVVPVHDLGIDDSGRCYFTMRLVRGRELKEVLDLAREGKEGWTTTKALGLILKVCEAMAYAHSKGVVHRDLKPSNIMVGRFGEVYVMDWGLARVIGRSDSHDLRPKDVSGVSLVRTVRRDESEANPDSPLVTMDGDVVGTPSFMAVEQAQGKLEEVGARSDVYSLGAILYFMLSGRSPYVEPGERISPHTVLNRVLAEPPVPVSKYVKSAPAELIAICDKAMARHAADRYASMLEVADDIQAFLEDRVVHAYEGGAAAEFKKWVHRNRGMAAATAALALLTIASAVGFAWQKGRQVDALNLERGETAAQRDLAEQNAEQARRSEGEAQENLALALQRKAEADENARIAVRNEDLARRSSYKANVVAADFSLRLNDVREARKRLDACDPDLRGWEWNHLDLKGDPALITAGPFGPIDGVEFLAGGERFASLSRSGRVRVHDTETGRVIEASGVSASVFGVNTRERSMSITRDGRRVALSLGSKRVKIYDVETGEELGVIDDTDEVPSHEGDVVSLAFGPSGRLLATGGSDGAVIVWNLERSAINGERRELRAVVEQRFAGHTEAVKALAWDAFGERLVTGSLDSTLRVWDVASERELYVLRGHQGAVTDVAWSLEGDFLVSSSADQTVILWDAASGRLEKSFLGHEKAVLCVDFHPDGERIVSGSADRTVRLWDVATRASEILRGHEDAILDLAFRQDGAMVLSGGADRLVKTWDVRGEPSSTLVLGAGSAVDEVFGPVFPAVSAPPHTTLALDPSSSRFAVDTGEDIAIWDGATGLVQAVLRGHQGAVTSLCYSEDGRYLLSGCFDKTARIWDVETGATLHVLEGHEKWVGAVAFSLDGTWCVTGSGDRRLRIWDTRTGKLLETLTGHEGRKGWIMGLAMHPDGERFASSAGDKRIRIWKRGSEKPLQTLSGHTRSVSSVDFHPDGHLLVSGGLDSSARMWDLQTGQCLFVTREHDMQVDGVAFHPDGTRFATASSDGSVRIWDVLSGEPLLQLTGFEGRVNAVDFTSNGERLLTVANWDVRIWETGGVNERVARWSVARARQKELVAKVNELFDRHHYLSDVLLRIASSAELAEGEKEDATRLARLRGEDVWRLDATTREIVITPDLSEDEYSDALRRARSACELDPNNAHLQCTLGAGQFRSGHYDEAISTLQLAGETNKRREERSDPAFSDSQEVMRLAFLAMSFFRAGEHEAAFEWLERARAEFSSNAGLRNVFSVASVLEEATRLIEGQGLGPLDEES